MKPFFLYKHINNTDVALMPRSVYYSPTNKVYKVKCYWYNIVNPNNIFQIESDNVEIKEEDMPKWELLPKNYQKTQKLVKFFHPEEE